MSVINNGLLLASAADAAAGYQISRSLRFNAADSAFLSRTPGSASNRRTWTWAGWVKRSALSGSDQFLFLCSTSNTSPTTSWLSFNSSEKLSFGISGSGRLITTQVFRDVSAWYHIVLAVDTTQATASNRYKLYVNGSQITAFDTADYVAQNTDTQINAANEHRIGRDFGSFTSYLNGYLADIHFCDGTAYDASAFGEFDATTGVWVPKTFSGSYGQNGFRLTFSDNSGTTATTLGKDAAGSNNFTPNNFSVATGAGNDSLVDVPTSSGTDTGVGGEVRGNYATINPLDNGGLTLANGNLDASRTTASWVTARATIGVSSGKWYWEVTCTSSPSASAGVMVGIATSSVATSSYVGAAATGYGYNGYEGYKFNNGSGVSYGATFTNGDVIGVALDLDAGTLTFYKNGSSQGQAYSGLPSGLFFPAFSIIGAQSCVFNAGARSFAYTAPSGFKALCTANLPAPLVTKPSTVFDTVLYAGNGSTQTITLSGGLSPDFVWTKPRNEVSSHVLFDIVRGTNLALYSNATTAETTETTSLTAFNSDGFSLGANNNVNKNNITYAAWCWDAGSSTVTNTQGSITSSVRANATAGFSIVSYTSVGTSGTIDTVGHGLGVSPSMFIVKNRDVADSLYVARTDFSNPARDYLQLNSTAAKGTIGADAWSFSSTTVGIRQATIGTASGQKIIVYCFAPVAGYSSAFSFTGNGSSDGVFQWLGFRARMILIKRTDTTGDWYMWDAVRNTFNVVNLGLLANSSGSELTLVNAVLDVNSNGFKLRGADAGVNASNGTYVGFAWAESPFQYARAR